MIISIGRYYEICSELVLLSWCRIQLIAHVSYNTFLLPFFSVFAWMYRRSVLGSDLKEETSNI
jgi:hypothetical protein